MSTGEPRIPSLISLFQMWTDRLGGWRRWLTRHGKERRGSVKRRSRSGSTKNKSFLVTYDPTTSMTPVDMVREGGWVLGLLAGSTWPGLTLPVFPLHSHGSRGRVGNEDRPLTIGGHHFQQFTAPRAPWPALPFASTPPQTQLPSWSV